MYFNKKAVLVLFIAFFISSTFAMTRTVYAATLNVPTVAYPTIQAAIAAANPLGGDTIVVAAGIYVEVGQIVISKDLSIIGAGASTTIIKPSADTGSSGDARGWFLINSGVTFNLRDVTLDGSGRKVFQALRYLGQGVVTECIFTNIIYPTYYGMAIAAMGSGNVDVSYCEFTQMGRIGIIYFGSGITGSTCSNNKFTGKGAGDWLDYAVEVGGGAHATITDNTISGNLGVASSDGSTSAGILVTTYFGAGTQALITGNTISGCTDGIAVGYDAFDTSSVTAHYNSFTGNTWGVTSTAPIVDATNNWWGDASGPNHATSWLYLGNPYGPNPGSGDSVTDYVLYDPWLSNPWPPPVGGEWVPVNAVQMLVQIVGSAAAISAIAASFVGLKRVKRRQN